MRLAQERLLSLVFRSFAGGVVTAEETEQMRFTCRKGDLSSREIHDVLQLIAHAIWGPSVADTMSDEERRKVETIVANLQLPDECLPEGIRLPLANAA